MGKFFNDEVKLLDTLLADYYGTIMCKEFGLLVTLKWRGDGQDERRPTLRYYILR